LRSAIRVSRTFPQTERVQAAKPVALAVTRLALSGFRSFADLRIDLAPAPVVLTGANGAGKTNLLEAVSLLSPGRGLRGARLAEMDRLARGGDAARPWVVSTRLAQSSGPVTIGTGREPVAPGGRERRIVRIDGAPVRGQTALAALLGVIWLTPAQDGLFRGPAQDRRRFLDRLVAAFDPDHAGRLAALAHGLSERLRLLREPRPDGRWLASIEDGIAGRAVAVAAARRGFVARLAQACALGTGPFPAAGVAITGDVEQWLDGAPALMVEDRLKDALAAARAHDAEHGTTSQGVHRSDLVVTHLARGLPASLCSTGEQKALLVSIILAHARLETLARGAPPLILLDEITAHLDHERRHALFDEIGALGAQAWLTGTDADQFAPLAGRAQIFRVEQGGVRLDQAFPALAQP